MPALARAKRTGCESSSSWRTLVGRGAGSMHHPYLTGECTPSLHRSGRASIGPSIDRAEPWPQLLPACHRRAAVHSAVGLRKRDSCGERSEMMAQLREGVAQHAALYLALGGLLLGGLFGAVVFATNFCTMGSL